MVITMMMMMTIKKVVQHPVLGLLLHQGGGLPLLLLIPVGVDQQPGEQDLLEDRHEQVVRAEELLDGVVEEAQVGRVLVPLHLMMVEMVRISMINDL